MTTEKQRAANRQNAQKSTGPITAAGRNRSKANALTHGLSSDQVVIFDESADELQNLYHRMISELMPMGALEEQLVERIVICLWRLRRVYRIETSLFAVGSRAQQIEALPETDDKALEASLRPLSDEDLRTIQQILKRNTASQKAWEEQKNKDALRPRDKARNIGEVFKSLAMNQGPLFQLSRHETTIERSLQRALHDLERIQSRRRGDLVLAPIALDISTDG